MKRSTGFRWLRIRQNVELYDMSCDPSEFLDMPLRLLVFLKKILANDVSEPDSAFANRRNVEPSMFGPVKRANLMR